MGLLKKLFSDDAPKQWEVKIKGTVQRNGPIPVNRTFIVDDIRQAQAFQGGQSLRGDRRMVAGKLSWCNLRSYSAFCCRGKTGQEIIILHK